MDYSEDLLRLLIECPKQITNLTKMSAKQNRAYSQRTGHLVSSSDEVEGTFELFVRQNNLLPEDFSVGLVHYSKDGVRTVLVRCNGDHGKHFNRVGDVGEIVGMHIHVASMDAINASLKPEHIASLAGYDNLESALQEFLTMTNITNREVYFPPGQMPLFEGGDD
jgi:hypothetical protein